MHRWVAKVAQVMLTALASGTATLKEFLMHLYSCLRAYPLFVLVIVVLNIDDWHVMIPWIVNTPTRWTII